MLPFVESLRRPLDEMGDGDLDVGQYRESYGSGLVNTRISDRENEVLYFKYRTFMPFIITLNQNDCIL